VAVFFAQFFRRKSLFLYAFPDAVIFLTVKVTPDCWYNGSLDGVFPGESCHGSGPPLFAHLFLTLRAEGRPFFSKRVDGRSFVVRPLLPFPR